MPAHDAIVVGSGPNGLAAAITLARAGWSVTIYEAKATVGGGMRTAELTLPGFQHDVCSAIHPLGMASPLFRMLPLEQFGLEWIQPDLPLAHPFDDGTAAALARSFEETGATLGQDARAYRSLIEPIAKHWDKLAEDILGPFPLPPRHPFLTARFGLSALRSARGLAESSFDGAKARGFFAGIAAHSILPLEKLISASFGLVLGALGHAVGWPLPRGGSQKIADAMAAYFISLGGKIVTDTPINELEELPSSEAVLFDLTPRQILRIAGDHLPDGYRRGLERYRYGSGVFKVDWALDAPIPWKAAACGRAGTVHLGGTLDEIALSERTMWQGGVQEKPYVLVAQQSLFDTTRAPQGKHTCWAYCHVPNGSTVDMTERIENQIERFAPGFRDVILARSTRTTAAFEQYNANYVGGDINGGVQDLGQLFTRPVWRLVPYSTPNKRIYLCSSSTPPGGGVHGMSGYHAANVVLKRFK